MDREDDKQLWDILGRVPEPTLSPFFARNVVRSVRQEATRFGRMRRWLSWRRLAAASAVVVARDRYGYRHASSGLADEDNK